MSTSIDAEIKLFGTTIKSNLLHQNMDPSSPSPPMVNIITRFKDPPPDLKEPPKATKKPDKILSCPRCQSINTKFCYYNNYNVNQPRYFCRNCQRYWTAGGSMRSVPIGSGRRKNKTWLPTSNHYLNITSQQQQHNNNNTNTILSFNSEKTLNHQGFLAPQVMLPNSSAWPYPAGTNASFYPMHVYLGCTSLETTKPCLGKRSRDEIEGGCKDNNNTETITRFVSETLRPSEGMLSKLVKNNNEKKQEFNLFNGFETTKGIINRRSLVTETSRNLQENPAAMSRSMNFRESIQH